MTRPQSDEQRLADTQQRDDWQWLMGDPRGRRLMWGVLAEAGIYLQTFTGELGTSAFNEGRRSMGLQMMDRMIRHAPDAWTQMHAEHRIEAAAPAKRASDDDAE
ncbi:MAG: hypothetical protein AB7K86_08580 [Rhodospirillales bacterium]